MSGVEKKVNEMIGQYTMNEYKAYKNLVKHKRRINRVFSEVCNEKSFPSRRPGRPVKMPCVAVASCSAMPLKASKKNLLRRVKVPPTRQRLLVFNPRRPNPLNHASGSVELPSKFQTLSFKQPLVLLR
jgi:hypothetical protein